MLNHEDCHFKSHRIRVTQRKSARVKVLCLCMSPEVITQALPVPAVMFIIIEQRMNGVYLYFEHVVQSHLIVFLVSVSYLQALPCITQAY